MFRSVKIDPHRTPDLEIIGDFSDRELSAAEAPEVQEAVLRPEFKGKPGQMVEAFPAGAPRILVLGLGAKEDLDEKTLREVAAAAVRKLAQLKVTRVNIRITSLPDMQMAGRCFGEALGMLSWRLTDFQGSGAKEDETAELMISGNDESFQKGLEYGFRLGESANVARTLAYTPPNIATTNYMADYARQMAMELGLKCDVIQGDDLIAEQMTGLTTVGGASEHKPCLIRLEYKPENAYEGEPAVVLIGKTITYDTGGYSLKSKTGMPGMKVDKSGGCAVLGMMHAVARQIKPRYPVVALLPTAENSVAGNAYRPDDVITYRNGLTVEVTNTDAEGRLVLADALCWAVDKENPAFIFDIATLTGGVVTALGKACAGYFSNSDMLSADLEEAARVSSEKVWRLPILQEHRDLLKSKVADIINSNLNGQAHAPQGAAFLSHFVPDKTPWIHLDVAGTSTTADDNGFFIPGPTGFGVRLVADLLRGPISVMME